MTDAIVIDTTSIQNKDFRTFSPSRELVMQTVVTEPQTIKCGRFEFLGQGSDKGILIDGEKSTLKVRAFDIHWEAGSLCTVKMDVIIDERVK